MLNTLKLENRSMMIIYRCGILSREKKINVNSNWYLHTAMFPPIIGNSGYGVFISENKNEMGHRIYSTSSKIEALNIANQVSQYFELSKSIHRN
jgi:hypothetical protein